MTNSKGVNNNFQNTNTNTSTNKPNFNNSKGIVNNNTPFNPDAKVEKQDVKREFKGNFTKSNVDNGNVKAPKKDYLEGDVDVKYKQDEEDINIERKTFKTNNKEAHFVDIKSNQEVFILFLYFLFCYFYFSLTNSNKILFTLLLRKKEKKKNSTKITIKKEILKKEMENKEKKDLIKKEKKR